MTTGVCATTGVCTAGWEAGAACCVPAVAGDVVAELDDGVGAWTVGVAVGVVVVAAVCGAWRRDRRGAAAELRR